jgi:stearoyl-CoA desaturase (delta-9 desaturase)
MVAPDPGDAVQPSKERNVSDPATRLRVTSMTTRADPSRGDTPTPSLKHLPSVADDRLCWTTIAGLSLIHVMSLVGIVWIVVNFSVATLALTAVLYVMCGLSVTAGYHRLFAHRAYGASPPVRWAMLVFGAAAFQNSALSWSADHRAHHADTDGAGDPHAITRGFWFTHIGWLFRRRTASADVSRLTDLWTVRSIRLQHRWYPVVAIGVGLVLPMAVAATWGDPLGGLFVAGFLRAGLMLQMTFSINSLAHAIGTRRYDPRSSARDSMLTALVTFGEGYHSFHHRFPFDYRNGARWWHYDPSKWLIWTMARVRLVTRPRSASPASVMRATCDRATPPDPPITAVAPSPKQPPP